MQPLSFKIKFNSFADFSFGIGKGIRLLSGMVLAYPLFQSMNSAKMTLYNLNFE
jgi:hypothetical protein